MTATDLVPAVAAKRTSEGSRHGGRALRVTRRIAAALTVILSVITLTFFVTHVVAPDPTSLFLGSAGFGSAQDEQAARQQVREQLGLDSPLPEQYVRFLSQVVRYRWLALASEPGHFGLHHHPANAALAEREARLALGISEAVPARSVVIPGTMPKEFPAGTFHVPCALLIGQRKESTDRKTSLNDVLRTFNVQV